MDELVDVRIAGIVDFRRMPGPNDPPLIDHRHPVGDLGEVLRELGDLDGAADCYRRALKIDEAHYGPDHPNVALRLNNLGALSYGARDFAAAVAHFRRALTIYEKHLPPEHPDLQRSRRHLALAEAALAARP